MSETPWRQAWIAYLTRLCPADELELLPFGPQGRGLALAVLPSYPVTGLTTWVTVGVTEQGAQVWRGLARGNELALTLDTDLVDAETVELVVETLQGVVLDDEIRHRTGERRPSIAANGIFAPGYAPHLVFTSMVPGELSHDQRKFGDRYVGVFAAIPIDDREVRQYDRSPAAFIDALENIWTYPRDADSL